MSFKQIPIGLICWIFLGFATSAIASPYQMTAELASSSIRQDEEAVVTVTVTAPDGLNIPVPLKPDVAGLTILLDRDNIEFNSLVKAGNIMAVKIFPFKIIADEPGEYSIPPFQITVAGTTTRTAALKLVVKGGSSHPPVNPGTGTGLPVQPLPPPGGVPTQNTRESFWLSATVNHTDVFVNEQVIYTIKLFTRESLEMENLGLPEWHDFWTEELLNEKRGSQIIDGVQYLTYEKVFALFPLKSGTIIIDPAEMQIRYTAYNTGKSGSGNFGPFGYSFNTNRPVVKKLTLKSDPITLTVAALPEPVPADFTGLVGNFSLKASLSESSAVAGDSVTLDIVIAGRGNINNAVLPKIQMDGLKIYEDKPTIEEVKTIHGVSGEKRFKLAVIAQQPGNFDFSKFSASYFDPVTASYESLRLEGLLLAVNGSASSTATVQQPTDLTQTDTSKTTLPWVIDPSVALEPTRGAYPTGWALLVFMPPLFLLLWGGWLVVNKWRSRPRDERELLKSSFRHVIRALKHSSQDTDKIMNGLREYFSHLLCHQSSAITALDIGRGLEQRGIAASVTKELTAELIKMESLGFSGHVAQREQPRFDILEDSFKRIHQELIR